jgi:hypothetical protein
MCIRAQSIDPETTQIRSPPPTYYQPDFRRSREEEKFTHKHNLPPLTLRDKLFLRGYGLRQRNNRAESAK